MHAQAAPAGAAVKRYASGIYERSQRAGQLSCAAVRAGLCWGVFDSWVVSYQNALNVIIITEMFEPSPRMLNSGWNMNHQLHSVTVECNKHVISPTFELPVLIYIYNIGLGADLHAELLVGTAGLRRGNKSCNLFFFFFFFLLFC